MRSFLAAGLVALAACSADLQVDRVCVTTPGYGFATTPLPVASAPLPPVQVPFSVGTAVPDLTKSGVHEVHVFFRSVDVDSSQSTAFVTTLTVSVLPAAGSALPKRILGTYQRPAGAVGTTVHVPGDGTDLFPYLQNGRLVLELSGEADPRLAPAGSFTADAQMCAEVQGSVDYL